MMQQPFQFGVPVNSEHFIGREEEKRRLAANLCNGINTILLSPRRWGKTSLVNMVSSDIASEDITVVRMDAFSCRSEYDFYNMFSESILKQTASRIDEWKELAKGFIERLVPKISISPEPSSEISVSLGITPKTHSPEEVLNLPQIIAQRKGCRLVICIDEFQQIGEFENSLQIQQKMRTVWQHQSNVTYCLFGSKLHMMTNFFLKKSYPFYKFGDILYLRNIPVETWIPYIRSRFEANGKQISDGIVTDLCHTVELQSSYVQQLAWYVLLKTDTVAGEDVLKSAVEDLIDQNSQVFIQQTQSLTSYQLNFLRALLAGVEDGFTGMAIRETYNLGTQSNITRLKSALIEKEIIEYTSQGLRISDPVLRLWLLKRFFR